MARRFGRRGDARNGEFSDNLHRGATDFAAFAPRGRRAGRQSFENWRRPDGRTGRRFGNARGEGAVCVSTRDGGSFAAGRISAPDSGNLETAGRLNAHRKALERLWKDTCTVWARTPRTDPATNLTDFEETALLESLPCKLSFEKSAPAADGHAAGVSQGVKLFCAPEAEIPAGCRVCVRRPGQPGREFVYAKSGEAAVFSDHQEIPLELWKGWA